MPYSGSISSVGARRAFFDPRGEAFTNGLLLLFPARGAAQDVGFLSASNPLLFDFDLSTHLDPFVLEELSFKELHLAARRAHQILTVSA
jgi:hypothetical protein